MRSTVERVVHTYIRAANRVRVTSVVDAGETTFRFGSVVERREGKNLEFFDAGEVDATGRISLVLTFSGPLAAAAHD